MTGDTQDQDLKERMRGLEERVGKMETQVGVLLSKLEGFAPQQWVREIVQPLKESIIRQEAVLEHLGLRQEDLFDLHEEVLRERAKQQKELNEAKIKALEDATFGNWLRQRAAPLLALFIGLATAWEIIKRLVTYVVQSVPHK